MVHAYKRTASLSLYSIVSLAHDNNTKNVQIYLYPFYALILKA